MPIAYGWRARAATDSVHVAAFVTVTLDRWVPAWRYTADLSNREDAEDFLDAVARISLWIENNI